MPKPGERAYLGDSVYVQYERGYIRLCTWNGYGDENIIYLEAPVVEALDRWRAELDKDIELRRAAGF